MVVWVTSEAAHDMDDSLTNTYTEIRLRCRRIDCSRTRADAGSQLRFCRPNLIKMLEDEVVQVHMVGYLSSFLSPGRLSSRMDGVTFAAAFNKNCLDFSISAAYAR